MPRTAGRSLENFFNKGLLTEFTGLNYPKDAATVANNVIFERTGKVKRRKGFDYEDNHSLTAVTRISDVISRYVWEAVGGDGNKVFLVVQMGTTLHFFNIDDAGEVSSNKEAFTVNLDTYRTASQDTAGHKCQYTSGNGDLFVAHPDIDPIYIEYDSSGNTITTTAITVQIRDLSGVSPDVAPNVRPTVAGMTNNHAYNLLNQGWSETILGITTGITQALKGWSTIRDPAALDDRPSLAEQVWNYKNASGAVDYTALGLNATIAEGNTTAPKGHYILDYFNQDRDTAAHTVDWTISGTPSTTSGNLRPTSIAFFAGRIWYAGTASRGYNSKILFSQVIESSDQYGLCYQNNDPTAEVLSDILSTDGGVINIPEIGTVVKLATLGSSLVILASNGVWSVTGSLDTGFTATEFSVTKIDSTANSSPDSVVAVRGNLYWWNKDGIYTLGINETSKLQVSSISENTIQSFYDDIPEQARNLATGSYNPLLNEIQWSYRSTTVADVDTQQDHNRILSMSFYEQPTVSNWTFDITDNFIHAPFFSSKNLGVFKYLITDSNDKMTVVEETDSTNWLDWFSFDSTGKDYSSVVTTGFQLLGDGLLKFQNNRIIVYMDTETGASVEMRGYWDFGSNSNSNKWSPKQECYPSTVNTNFSIQKSSLIIRGEGKALQLNFTSTTGNPFTILGWSSFITVNDGP